MTTDERHGTMTREEYEALPQNLDALPLKNCPEPEELRDTQLPEEPDHSDAEEERLTAQANIEDTPPLQISGRLRMPRGAKIVAYIAGPMRGYPQNNYPLFYAAAKALRRMYPHACFFNPAEREVNRGFKPGQTLTDKQLRWALRWDFSRVVQSNTIILLPGWQDSEFGRIEASVAHALGLMMVELVKADDSLGTYTLRELNRDHLSFDLKWAAFRAQGVTHGSLPDTGERSNFSTGAVRDAMSGKGKPSLMSPLVLRRLSQHFEAGARKYDDRNWEKGIPLSRYVDAIYRHLWKSMLMEGNEDHEAALMWNVHGLMWTREMIRRGDLPKELDDLCDIREGNQGRL